MAEERSVKQKQIHGVEAPIDDTVAGGVEDRRQVSSSIPDDDDGSPPITAGPCAYRIEREGKRCRVGSKQAGCRSGRTRVKLELLTSYRRELPCRILA